jgi:uncharacterized membrane protein YphA (DoxX/SURF4 family)
MVSKLERFWITIILRFAMGFFFLLASLQQFSAAGPLSFGTEGPKKFADTLSKGFSSTVLGDIAERTGFNFSYWFLFCLPYVFGVLAIMIITGIFARPALRLGAILLVCLGLGKYLQGDVSTTANDFLFALIICIGLYFMSLERKTVVTV